MVKLIIVLLVTFNFTMADQFIDGVVVQGDTMEEIQDKCKDVERLAKSVAFDILMSDDEGEVFEDVSSSSSSSSSFVNAIIAYKDSLKVSIENVTVVERLFGNTYIAGCKVRQIR